MRFLYFIIVILICMVPFSGNNSPFKYPYQLLVVVAGFGGVIILNMYLQHKERWKRDFAFLIISIFVIILLSILFNLGIYSLEGLFDAFSLCLSLLVCVSVAHVIDTEAKKEFIYKCLLVLVFLNFIFGLLQLYFGADIIFGNPPIGGRISGLFSWGAPVVGSFAGLVFPLIVYLFIDHWRKFVAYFTFFICVIMLGGNRSLLIADVLTLVFILLFSKNYKKYSILFVFFIACIVIFIVPYVLLNMQDLFSDNLLYRLDSLGGDIIEEQKGKRIATWIQTYYMVLDNPFFGVGPGNYKASIVAYLHVVNNSEGVMPHPHHVYLDIISILGVIGFSFFIILASYLIYLSKKYINNEKVLIENLLIILIIFSPLNVTHGLVSSWWSFLCFMMLGIVVANINIYMKNIK